MEDWQNPKPVLTIMDLLATKKLPDSVIQPRRNFPGPSHRRIVVGGGNPYQNGATVGNILTSFSANNFHISPQFTASASESEDPADSIPIFSHHYTQPTGSSLPNIPIQRHPIQHMSFDEVCSDNTVTLNPRRLNFIPSSSWPNESMSFGMIVSTFFRKRNSTHCKFPFKLFNALQITERYPEFIPHVGVQWATDTIIKVDREPFARLIGVKTIEGSLFHQQGNFPSHGFVELPFKESDQLSRSLHFGPADLSVVRYVTHIAGKFIRGCTEEDLDQCRWSNTPSPFYVSNQ